MMEKRSAHARPKQQMGEVRVTSTVRIIPQKSAINPIKDDGSVGTTKLKATLHQWSLFKFKKCQQILQQITKF